MKRLRSIYNSIYSKIRYPYVATVDGLTKHPCRFEVTGPIEEFRIKHWGGEEKFLRMILDACGDGSVLYDIGGCVGIVSIPAAKLGARVYCFEPDPNYRTRLQKNIGLNQLSEDRLKVFEYAVSDVDGEMTLFTDGVEGRSASLVEVGERGSVTVGTRTIDNLLEEQILDYPNVIKLDIEGAEILALRGMIKLLSSENAPRCIFCELHPQFLGGFGSSMDECISILTQAEYKCVYSEVRKNQHHFLFEKAQ